MAICPQGKKKILKKIKKKTKKIINNPGSANINDRSMLGDRDSELCTVTTDNSENCITVNWNGQEVQVRGRERGGEEEREERRREEKRVEID